jgi:hypothetical protein
VFSHSLPYSEPDESNPQPRFSFFKSLLLLSRKYTPLFCEISPLRVVFPQIRIRFSLHPCSPRAPLISSSR